MKTSLAKRFLAFTIALVIVAGIAVGIYFLVTSLKGNNNNAEDNTLTTVNLTISDSAFYNNLTISINKGEAESVKKGDTIELKEGDTVTISAVCNGTKTITQQIVGGGSNNIITHYGIKLVGITDGDPIIKTATNFKKNSASVILTFTVEKDVESYTIEELITTLTPIEPDDIR